jgi:hypothetical protein
MAQVATAIQTRLAAALSSTTCTWDGTGEHFIITSPTTGMTSIVLYATTPGSGDDISGLLFLTFDDWALVAFRASRSSRRRRR